MTQNERLKEIRKSLNLTMEKFGERLGVSKATISIFRNGNRNLTLNNDKIHLSRVR